MTIRLLLASTVLLALGASHAAASNLSQCRLDLADGAYRLMRAEHKALASCVKGSASGCQVPLTANDDLVAAATGVDGACVAAVVNDGAAYGDLAPTTCTASWSTCSSFSYSPVESFSDVARCHDCMLRGQLSKISFDLDRPAGNELSDDARRCLAKTVGALGKAAERGLAEAIRCAREAGEDPSACSTEPVADSAFAKALAKIGKSVARCEDALAEPASALAGMCHRPIVSLADLETCAREAAVCRACASANAVFGLGQDCAAQSGDRLCNADLDRNYGRPDSGNVLVANRGSNSVSMYDGYLQPRLGTLAASSVPVGMQPVDIVINGVLGLAYVVNRGDSTLTMLDSGTGAPSFGTLASSSFAVGAFPSAATFHSARGILYVANEGDGTVTFLDGSDGSTVYADLMSSSFVSGRGPSSVEINESADLLYVANADDDTVTFLDAVTGAPAFGNLAASTFPVGDEPRHVLYLGSSNELLVTNHGDGTVTSLDARTGLPSFGSLASSTYAVGAGPVASAFFGGTAFTALREGQAVAAHAEPPFGTVSGPLSDDLLGTTSGPGDLLPGYESLMMTLGDEDLLAVMPAAREDALLGVSPEENASIVVPSWYGNMLAADPVTGDFYTMTSGYSSGFTVVDPVARSSSGRGAYSGGRDVVAVNAAAGILFVESADRGITMFDAATGNYRNGTLEASTIEPICAYPLTAMLVAPASNTLFVGCGDRVLYLDASTGAYRSGSAVTSTVTLADFGGTLALDETADRLYVDVNGYLASGSVVALTITSVGFASGTFAASQVIVDSYGSGIACDPATGTLYRGYSDGSVKLFSGSGSPIATVALGGEWYPGLAVDPARGILYVARNGVLHASGTVGVDDVVYLKASDGSFLHSSVEDSSVILGPYGSVSAPCVNPASNALVVPHSVGFDRRLVLVDPDEPALLGSRSAFSQTVPTQDDPSALAVVPYVYP